MHFKINLNINNILFEPPLVTKILHHLHLYLQNIRNRKMLTFKILCSNKGFFKQDNTIVLFCLMLIYRVCKKRLSSLIRYTIPQGVYVGGVNRFWLDFNVVN